MVLGGFYDLQLGYQSSESNLEVPSFREREALRSMRQAGLAPCQSVPSNAWRRQDNRLFINDINRHDFGNSLAFFKHAVRVVFERIDYAASSTGETR
jgi:hypothetical protein